MDFLEMFRLIKYPDTIKQLHRRLTPSGFINGSICSRIEMRNIERNTLDY